MSIAEITALVAEKYGYTVKRLLSKDRDPGVSEARNVTWYVANCSMKDIAAAFHRSETSMMNGLLKVKDLIKRERAVAERVNILMSEIKKIDADRNTALKRARGGLVASLAAKAAKDSAELKSIENQITLNVNIVRDHLRKEDFKFHESSDEEKYVFQGSICGDGEIIDVFNWRIMVEDDCLQGFFSLPTHCSEKKRGRMAEFINLVNWPLRWGKLTMDAADDGELMLNLENFGGIAIAATNLEKNLDSAVLRRFTLKLHMGYLTNEAKVEFFTRYFKTSLSEVERARLDRIELVPGDYRCARQKLFYTSDKPDNNLRLAALESESAVRGPKRARIGF